MRLVTHISNGPGFNMMPDSPSFEGRGFSAGNSRLNCWSRLTKIRKSSVLARLSPIQRRRPESKAEIKTVISRVTSTHVIHVKKL